MVTAKKKTVIAKPATAPATPRPVRKPAARPAAPKAPPVVPATVKSLAKAFAPSKDEKPAKAKKPKMVRDSFTIPKAEYAVLDELKQRATRLAHPAKKSELLRAGIKALVAMSDTAFLAALQAVPAIKTGRPKNI